MKEQIFTLPANDTPTQANEVLYRLPPAPMPPITEDTIRTIQSETFNNFSDIMNVVKGNVKSGNFITGISGWKIDANGNVEFNDGTFRGNFQIGGTLITVSDIADLQTSINAVSSAGGGTVALVPDTYTATSGFTIPSSVSVDGNGSTIDFGGGAYQFLIQGTSAYSTGTLAVNYGSTALVGTGTTWTAGMVGQSILIGDYWYAITARTDNTHLTIGSNYIGTNITGASYVIATTVNAVSLSNITLTNSSGTALKYRYVNGFNIGGVLLTDSTQGLDGDDSANVNFILGSGVDNCVTGMTANNNPFMIIDGILLSNITGGTAIDLNGVTNTSMGSVSLQGITGVGLKFTNCYNLGFVNYSIIETTSHGIEFVSGNSSIDLISGYTDTTGGDAIKLTATTDNVHMIAQTLKNYSGYGINIVASSCDNNVIVSPTYGGGGSGTLNDSGTGTVVLPDDTVYGASWNGSLSSPTKNAVYDKIEALGTSGPLMRVSTVFETAARFVVTNTGGAGTTFGTSGIAQTTSGTVTSSSSCTLSLSQNSSFRALLGSPAFSASLAIITTNVSSGAASSFFGIGDVTVTGSGHTYTTAHVGFKVVKAAAAVNLYATQGDGSTETASAALRTSVGNGDPFDVLLKMNGTTSVDYYTRLSGGTLSAATNLTTNVPSGNNNVTNLQCSLSNDATAFAFSITPGSISYER